MIRRGPRPDNGYYILSRQISEDSRLSWAARGLLVFLLSKPDDWKVSVTHLVKQSPAGRDHVRSLIQELIATGYMVRRPRRLGGKFQGVEYVVSEASAPQSTENTKFSPETDFPAPVEPSPVFPAPENPLQISTDYDQVLNIPKTDTTTTPPPSSHPPLSMPPTPLGGGEALEEINEYVDLAARFGGADKCRNPRGLRRYLRRHGLTADHRAELTEWRQMARAAAKRETSAAAESPEALYQAAQEMPQDERWVEAREQLRDRLQPGEWDLWIAALVCPPAAPGMDEITLVGADRYHAATVADKYGQTIREALAAAGWTSSIKYAGPSSLPVVAGYQADTSTTTLNPNLPPITLPISPAPNN